VVYFLPNHDNFWSIASKHESLDDGDEDHDDEDHDVVDHYAVMGLVGMAASLSITTRTDPSFSTLLSITTRTDPSFSTLLVVVHKELDQ